MSAEAPLVPAAPLPRVPSPPVPMIGPIDGVEGAYVATGHSVWGILNAPATGEALAQLIRDGVSNIDLSPFRPGRMG